MVLTLSQPDRRAAAELKKQAGPTNGADDVGAKARISYHQIGITIVRAKGRAPGYTKSGKKAGGTPEVDDTVVGAASMHGKYSDTPPSWSPELTNGPYAVGLHVCVPHSVHRGCANPCVRV